MSQHHSQESVRVLGVIPARLHSPRRPRKVLREIAGRPLLAWVYQAAAACAAFDRLVIAVDSEEVAALCEEHHWPWRMTSPTLPSGTDRLHAIAQEIPAQIYVNIQGDEPLLTPAHFEALLRPFQSPSVDVATLKVPCPAEELHNPSVVKVVTAQSGQALYFSRASIPYQRDRPTPGAHPVLHWKHLGLYAYRRAALDRFAALAPSELEQIEQLEQLRLLENGLSLYVAKAPSDAQGVNTEEELQKVEAILRTRSPLRP